MRRLLSVLLIGLQLFASPAWGALASGLVSCWTMDEASGTRNDSVGSSHLTDNNTVASTTGKVSTAADFDNSATEFLSMSGNPGGGQASGGAFSVSLWFASGTGAGDHVALGRYDGTKLFQIYHSNGTMSVAYGVSPFDVITGSSLSVGTAYHLVFTFSATGTGTFYINGSSVGSDGSLTGAFNSSTDLNIGRRGGDGAAHWFGWIDEVHWWNRAIDSSEVTDLYNSGNGRSCAYAIADTGATPNYYRRRIQAFLDREYIDYQDWKEAA